MVVTNTYTTDKWVLMTELYRYISVSIMIESYLHISDRLVAIYIYICRHKHTHAQAHTEAHVDAHVSAFYLSMYLSIYLCVHTHADTHMHAYESAHTRSMLFTDAVFHAPMAALKTVAVLNACEPTNAKVDSGAECS